MVILLIVQIIVFVLGLALIVYGFRVATEEKGSIVIIGAFTVALGLCASAGTLIYFLAGTLPRLLSP